MRNSNGCKSRSPARARGAGSVRIGFLADASRDSTFRLEGLEWHPDQLFDLDADPDEIDNLATDPKKNGEIILALNEKMNQLIEDEVREPDDGRFLPGENRNWAAATFDP